MLLVCLCTCGRSSSMREHPSMSTFFTLTFKLQNCNKHRWEPRQTQNGDPDREGRVVWKADKFHQEHNENSTGALEKSDKLKRRDRQKKNMHLPQCGACSCLITVCSTVSLLYFSPIAAKIRPTFQFGAAERKSFRIICNSQTSLWKLFHYI